MNKRLLALNKYKYKTPDLVKALGVSRMTLYTWEQEGKFTPPRNTQGSRVFTENQIRDIVKAFSPGGKREWHFKPGK